MALSATEKKHFRGIGHHLKPVVMVGGNGLSETVLAELERALEEHELIKVKVAAEDRDTRRALVDELPARCGCEIVATIGNIALIYRAARKQNPKLSNLVRFSGS
ncbi:MAG: ribosome assembly RNA-binding protein YhbY [Gammaproteobacteria bacterium]